MGFLAAKKTVVGADGRSRSVWDKTTLYRWLVLAGVSLSGDGWTYEATVMGSVLQMPAFIYHLGYSDGVVPDKINSLLGPIYTLGQLFGGLFAAFISDWFGRKMTLYVGSTLVILSNAMLIASPNVGTVIAARVIQGWSIGCLLLGYQVYASELASKRDRGFVGSFSLVTGNVFGFIASCIVFGITYVTSSIGWQLCLAVGFIPTCTLLVLLPFVPESPRWLYQKGRHEEARNIMGRFHGWAESDELASEARDVDPVNKVATVEDSDGIPRRALGPEAQEAWDAMQLQINEDREKGYDKWQYLIKTPSARYRLWMALSSQLYWAWNGSSIETYYYIQAFDSAGISDPHLAFGIGSLLNLMWIVSGFVGAWLLDLLGRRFNYVTGLAQMSFFLFLQGIISIRYFDNNSNPSKVAGAIWVTIYLVKWILWVALFSSTVNVLPSELWPTGLRARAFALANVVSMGSGFATQYSALPMYRKLNGWVWIVFGAIMALFAFLTWFTYAEPKGLLLEEMEVLFGSSSGDHVAEMTGRPLRDHWAPLQKLMRRGESSALAHTSHSLARRRTKSTTSGGEDEAGSDTKHVTA